MTHSETSARDWTGEKGRIDPELLSRLVFDHPAPIYYVAGPPMMVRTVSAMLSESGIDPTNIGAEEFDGY